MEIKFQTQINEKDLYKFNMRYAYTNLSTIFTTILGFVLLFVLFWKWDDFMTGERMMYGIITVLLIIYVPLTMWFSSKNRIANMKVFSAPLFYTINEEGINVKSEVAEEDSLLPWNLVYKAVTTKEYLYIHSGRGNAYIIPKQDIENQIPEIKEALTKYVEEHRLEFKW